MNLHWFANVLVHHPYIVVSAVAVFSSTCLIIPFTLNPKVFPDFSDPEMGFSTRGTIISNRLTAWKNLVEATSPSGQFAINPKEMLLRKNDTFKTKQKKRITKKQTIESNYSKIYIDDSHNHSDHKYDNDNWKTLKDMLHQEIRIRTKLKPIEIDGFFCGGPDHRYIHLVLKSMNNVDLFSLESLLALCRIERQLIEVDNYKDLCIENTKTPTKCCKPWSLANYIAILHNRTNCLAITERDVNSTKSLLDNCSQYYYNLELTPDCEDKGYCDVPSECIKHDAVFNVLNFLSTTSFLQTNITDGKHKLFETMIFLPIACSTAVLSYYHKVEKLNLEYEGISVVAMDFGIKNALFDEFLIRDISLMILGGLFIFVCMWLYTESLFLTIVTIIAIIFSLGISYFMYMLVFEISFFPFMNLLAIVVAIGIGADDAFIFCKIYQTLKREKSSSMVVLMTDTFNHAFSSMFVTTVTTSVAFLASYISSVTAVCCFSIFAGTSVIINYLLMMTWFPACVIIWERSFCSNTDLVRSCIMICSQRSVCLAVLKPQWILSILRPKCSIIEKIWSMKERLLLETVISLRYFWLISFSLIAIGSAVIVLYYPKLSLPTSPEFQLFHDSHPFELYDNEYKKHFWFERSEKSINNEIENNYKLPLRFVWGVLPVDNGDHLNPASFGKLVLDETFDMSHPDSQLFLLKFCQNLRSQPFYQPTYGPLLPNCFIETFMKSMQRKCVDPFSTRNRSPCCESSKFPYDQQVFDDCIVEEISEIYATPSQYSIPGMAGPKFSKDQSPSIKAVIVEYDSNYTYSMSYEQMHRFYMQVESFMQEQLKKAPVTMKNGWFISDLEFYDLQMILSESTSNAIIMSMALALAVLLLSTLNILTSLYAIFTIACSIFVTMAILVLLGWKLNILESIAVSTAIGLTVDFSLHYAVNYRMCPAELAGEREAATRYAIANMAGPALMAALTTGAAGAFMLPSSVLAYIQIGIFLVAVTAVSWLFATFQLGALLAIAGPINRFGQLHYASLCRWRRRGRPGDVGDRREMDAHEMDALTDKIVSNRNTVAGNGDSADTSSNTNVNCKNANRYVPPTDQSPSATSAITIIIVDDS